MSEYDLIKELLLEKFKHFDKRLDKLEVYTKDTLVEINSHKLKHSELQGRVNGLSTEISSVKEVIKSVPEDRKTISTLQIIQNFFVKLLFITIPVMITLIIQAYFLQKGP